MSDPRVIHAPDAAPDWRAFDERVQKIVLGGLGDEYLAERGRVEALPADLAERFPNLTHLYLWGLTGLCALPKLPRKLQCLDIRGARNLLELGSVPPDLHTLVVQRCPALKRLPLSSEWRENLRELSLAGSSALPDADLQAWIQAASALHHCNLSGCEKLTTVDEWPDTLDDLRLNDCTGLTSLPEWPSKLRRLELRGTKLAKLHDFPESIDYVDLGSMRSLRTLPKYWGKPRTLFLFGSGLLSPPASEHGAEVDENVAERTRRFFEDVELTGEGTIQRCKLLLLGNGGVGKTCLSLRLTGGKPEQTKSVHEPEHERIGSTHGVQFHPWSVTIPGDKKVKVAVHLWDFGGQDIYHNTHRLFLGTGTVFVVVWNPDAKQAKTSPDEYQDTPRSLTYWLDYIEQATWPLGPEIVIVCSHQTQMTSELNQKLAREVGAERLAKYKPFAVDALAGTGELGQLLDELKRCIGEVVAAQGTSVSAYWEIAQRLVQDWVERSEEDAVFAAEHRQMTRERFGNELGAAIQAACKGKEPRYAKLRAAKDFALDEDRLVRTLEFLTRSGFVFWSRSLLDQRVIIGQRWALAGLYTLLERTRDGEVSPVWKHLTEHDGRFTLQELEQWGWSKDVPDPAERELLLTFMERIGLCFTLVHGKDSWWGRPTYVSLAHLPPRSAGHLAAWGEQRQIDLRYESVNPDWRRIERADLHQGHWDSILRSFGARFGTDAGYARDAFVALTDRNQWLHVEFDLAESGSGGVIRLRAVGDQAAELEESVAKAIEDSIAAAIERRTASGDVGTAAGAARGARSVFLSYAWDPEHGAPKGYEVPVDRIQAALRERGLVVLRDRFVLKKGDSIVSYNAEIKHTDRVIVVHSDRYWKSAYCMHELTMFCKETHRVEKSLDALTLVSHVQTEFSSGGRTSGGPLRDAHARNRVLEHWRDAKDRDLPTPLIGVVTTAALRSAVDYFFEHIAPSLAGQIERELHWDEAKSETLLAEILRRVQS